MPNDKEINLGGCYHDGVVYSLAYDANGEIELCDKTFTTLNTGIDGGAEAALLEHRKNFDPHRDVPRFIIALKPTSIIGEPIKAFLRVGDIMVEWPQHSSFVPAWSFYLYDFSTQLAQYPAT